MAEQNESRIYRDYRSKKTDVAVKYDKEARQADIACKIALAVADHPLWKDEVVIFDKVLTIIDALDADGFVLGRFSMEDENADS